MTGTSVVRAEENQAGFPNEKGTGSNGRLEFLVGPWKVIVFILLTLGKIAHLWVCLKRIGDGSLLFFL